MGKRWTWMGQRNTGDYASHFSQQRGEVGHPRFEWTGEDARLSIETTIAASILAIGNINVARFARLYCDTARPSRSQKQATTKHMMKLGGFLLLLSGWGIVVAALKMLHGSAVSGFVLAGFIVDILGFALVLRAHVPEFEDQR
jgi:hypothetical protein